MKDYRNLWKKCSGDLSYWRDKNHKRMFYA